MRSLDYIDAPLSPLSGVQELACSMLGIASIRHRSALLEIGRREVLPSGLVEAIYERISANWRACSVQGLRRASTQNWRWREPKLALGVENVSPEVRLERGLVAASEARGRADWANQVPVASGIGGSSSGRRRAIDLVHRRAPGWFELIELKVASDTPLYAALEIAAYACMWMLARSEREIDASEILAAERVDAIVLAPQSYYARYSLAALERLIDAGLSAVAAHQGVRMTFALESFADAWAAPPLSEENMMAILDRRGRIHPCA